MKKPITSVLIALLIATTFFGEISIAHAAHKVTIKGRFTYGGGKPVMNAYVELFDRDPSLNIDDKVADGYTDENGYFNFEDVSNKDYTVYIPFNSYDVYGIDAYVKCYAKNQAVNVMYNPSWMNPWGLIPGIDAGTVSYETSEFSNLKDGAVIDMGEMEVYGEPFNVFNTIFQGYKFMVGNGFTPPQVDAFWDDSFTPADSYYMPWNAAERYSLNEWWSLIPAPVPFVGIPASVATLAASLTEKEILRSLRGIHIKTSKAWTESTILHEYGHFIMDHYADFWPPDTVLGDTDKYAVFNPRHAWGEGWAHFFSAAARRWAGYSYSDYSYIEKNNQSDSVEAAVAGVLWDMHDTINEDGDEMQATFSYLLNVLRNYDPDPSSTWDDGKDHAWDIYDFFWGCYDQYPSTITDVYKIFKLHGITVPGVEPPPEVTISPSTQYLRSADGPSNSFTINVTNKASKEDTFQLSINGLEEFDTSLEKQITIPPGQTKEVTLTIATKTPSDACILEDFEFDVEAESTIPIYMKESAEAKVRYDFKQSLPTIPQGGLAVAILPKITYTDFDYPVYEFSGSVDIRLTNNQNFDDAITLKLSLDGIASNQRANKSWFKDLTVLTSEELTENNDTWPHWSDFINKPDPILPHLYATTTWSSARIFVPAKSSIILRLQIRTDFFVMSKIFKITAASRSWPSSRAQDSGLIWGEIPV